MPSAIGPPAAAGVSTWQAGSCASADAVPCAASVPRANRVRSITVLTAAIVLVVVMEPRLLRSVPVQVFVAADLKVGLDINSSELSA